MVRFAAGNRDESVFPCAAPCRLIGRMLITIWRSVRALTFALGAQLARTELQIAMTTLLRRTDNWALVEGKNSLKHTRMYCCAA